MKSGGTIIPCHDVHLFWNDTEATSMIQQQTAFLAVYEPWDCLTSSTKAPTNKKMELLTSIFMS